MQGSTGRGETGRRLIVGLGNPGPDYSASRHNVGFVCLGHVARAHGIHLDRRQALARVGVGEVDGVPVVLARPQTFMNASGQSVSRLVKRFGIQAGDLVVIHDDLDLPLGKIRIRPGGSSGGHRGVSSIISYLGTPDFPRLRVGIGRPAHGPAEGSEADTIGYVLGDFTPEERLVMAEVIPRVGQAIECILAEGLALAMERFN